MLSSCNEKKNEMPRCKDCKMAHFCDKVCLKKGWKAHKKDCRKYKAALFDNPSQGKKTAIRDEPKDHRGFMELLGRDAVARGYMPPMNEYESYKKEREEEMMARRGGESKSSEESTATE